MKTILLDERSAPSLRQVLGACLARAEEADFAIARIRLAAVDLTASELAAVRRCRVLVGRLDNDAFGLAGGEAGPGGDGWATGHAAALVAAADAGRGARPESDARAPRVVGPVIPPAPASGAPPNAASNAAPDSVSGAASGAVPGVAAGAVPGAVPTAGSAAAPTSAPAATPAPAPVVREVAGPPPDGTRALLRLIDNGLMEIRNAGLQRWEPDFSIMRRIAGSPRGTIALFGAHYFTRPFPVDGPALTCIVTDPGATAAASARFEELWRRGYNVSGVVRSALERLAERRG